MEHHINRKPLLSPEIALANEVFDQFCNATTLKSILGQFRHLCDLLKVKPTNFNQFYPKLKSKLRSWKAQALWKKFDQRANHKCYNRGKACLNTRVLIIGGGPCGMRSAIEAQLLGAKVVVVEKRDRMSRNNVLHLWPFVIQDLRSLGAKKFFGKFCAGSIDHISIRQLQCILLKVALILGVEFHESVSFESLVEPPDNQEEGKIGWRVKTTPADHPVSQYEFDVLIGADGKRNTLEGFKRKEFRGKLAIAITANFINKKTEAEARVEEISGVAFIFNQKFFKELYQDTGIDLENIVYYKDDTHYFVMTAKKHSLIDKGVILQDYMDTAKLLAKENVDREALMQYAREAADFSTEYQMTDLEFAVNHYGQPDVAMFDFTSMYAADNASKVIEKKGHRLLMCLVGDSLLEPFWPTGSGCARGFLSSLDACWAIKGWGSNLSPLEVIAERESIYRLLGQTTPENLNRDYAAYTLDPHTRYPNLNTRSVTMAQVISQINTDDPETLKQVPVHTALDLPKKRKRRDTQIHPDTLLHWLQRQVALYDGVRIHDMGISFKNGLALAAIVHRYRPDLIDFGLLNKDDAIGTNQLVFDILEKELGITSIMTGDEMVNCEVPDKLSMFSYLTQIYELFRGEIPHIKHQKLEPENEDRPTFSQKLNQLTPEQKAQLLGRIANKENSSRPRRSRHVNENYVSNVDKKVDAATRRTRKRRSNEKMGASVDRDAKVHLGHNRGNVDEEFSGRIKNFEEKLKGMTPAEKKPKDLLRAIGKIEKSDWNVKEIEKKIEENKMGRGMRQDKVERVPKWSREQFLARQTKMEKKGKDEPMETDSKYAEIDNTIKNIDKKIKEGNVLGHNKVSAMAEQFSNKNQDTNEGNKVQRSNSKVAIALPAQGGSEMCHFCEKRVYLMERLTAEGKSFHRGCFRCEYCSTSLRIGNHMFDRDKDGGRFYCTQHFGLSGTIKTRVEKKKISLTNKENIPQPFAKINNPDKPKTSLEGVVGLDLLDRGQTPERIEFENLAEISDTEEAHSQMDEDEWTDRNFGPSAAEMCSSDEISDMSDSDDDNEVFEEAVDQPLTTEGTLELAKNWTLRYSHPHPPNTHSDTGSNEYEDSSDDYTSTEEESGTATEDEEDVRAIELRKQEVWLQAPPQISDTETGSETEIASGDESLEDSEENSATEISTDSEFEHDGTTPTQHEIPQITINDAFVRKTRGDFVPPKKVQVKSHVITSINGNLTKKQDSNKKQIASKNETSKQQQRELNSNTVTTEISKANTCSPLINPRKGDYLLSKTHSTEGIASKLSIELKKKYLLGNSSFGGSVMKSGSTSNIVDTRLRNLSDSISQHQKLLNAAHEPSPTVQAFFQGTNKFHPTSPLSSSPLFANLTKSLTSDKINSDLSVKTNLASKFNDSKNKINQLPDLINETSIKTIPEVTVNNAESTKEPLNKVTDSVTKETPVNGRALQVNEQDENGVRPRSPLHETSIIVPQVDWDKTKEKEEEKDTSEDSDIDTDSLSSSELELDDEKKKRNLNLSPPRLQIHSTDGYLLLDEQAGKCKDSDNFEPDSIECQYNNIEDPLINQVSNIKISDNPVILPTQNELTVENVNNNLKKLQLQNESKKNNLSACSSPTSIKSASSKQNDESEENEATTTALTETEISEWARDGHGIVPEDLQDSEYGINSGSGLKNKKKLKTNVIKMANSEDLTDDGELDSQHSDKKGQNHSTIASKLLNNGEDIGFMDTDNDSVLDDSLQEIGNILLPKNRGYIEFVNFKTPSTPVKNNEKTLNLKGAPIARTENENDSCSDTESHFDENIIKISPVRIEDVMDRLSGAVNKNKKAYCDIRVAENKDCDNKNELLPDSGNKELLSLSMDEDSLLMVEQTEDTTNSELTTILANPINSEESNSVSIKNTETNKNIDDVNNPDYLEYVKRLQSRIAEFSNAKDSIDIRKSKRKNSKSSIQSRTSEMISEEIKSQESSLNNSNNSPTTSRKLEELTKERSKQKTLIQDLLMDKLEAHKLKSAEKRAKRAARASSFTANVSPLKPPPTPPDNNSQSSASSKNIGSSVTDNTSSSTNITPVNSPTRITFSETKKSTKNGQNNEKPLSIFNKKIMEDEINNEISLIEYSSDVINKNDENTENEFKTPVAPPRSKHEDVKKTAEKIKQDARERARLKSDEDLGLSPEDKIKQLRLRIPRRQLSMDDKKKSNDEEVKTKRYSFGLSYKSSNKLQTSKSTDNVKAFTKKNNDIDLVAITAKSLDELVQSPNASVQKRDKKKSKDPERRRSIIQAVSEFFKKKDNNSPSPNSKDKLSMFRLTQKSKDKGKLFKSYSDGSDLDKIIPVFENNRPKSVCEGMLDSLLDSPSSNPPLPINYTLFSNPSDDESLSDEDSKTATISMSPTNKNVNTAEDSSNSNPKKIKSSKRLTRQAQLKRLRMAQEIQRKLEETEVKQRELESRGVSVEKALRGEGECVGQEESELLREWYDLMRERTEIRRYEKELLVRAQEVQLEDRHDRLEQELRERLADDDKKKTSADVKKEGEILTEMLEIVARRDSLIALLEEERHRYEEEDRDIESQMLDKGLRLTPVKSIIK